MKEKAFTLIELLVVIAILGLLASVVLLATKPAREKARIIRGLQFSASVHHALGTYAVGVWDFENNLNDSSGYDNHGTWEDTGGPAPASNFKCTSDDTPSGRGCSLEFDGSGDYVEVADDASLNITNNLTISLWMKVDSIADRWIIDKSSDDYKHGYLIRMDTPSNTTWLIIGDGTSSASSPSATITTDTWYHIAGTYDGSYIRFYLNGTEQGSGNAFSGSLSYIGTSDLFIGSRNGTDLFFKGSLHDLRIYEEALSSAQIRQLYVEGAKLRRSLAKDN